MRGPTQASSLLAAPQEQVSQPTTDSSALRRDKAGMRVGVSALTASRYLGQKPPALLAPISVGVVLALAEDAPSTRIQRTTSARVRAAFTAVAAIEASSHKNRPFKIGAPQSHSAKKATSELKR